VRKPVLLFASTALAVLLACGMILVASKSPEVLAQEKPNIIYILTDDLDTRTLNRMEMTRSLLADKGVTFTNATFSTPLCCPSRATMQRGQYPHNTGVMGNGANPPFGGFQTFYSDGLHRSTYATWLDAAGYRTGYFGKYMNGYDGDLAKIWPPGWDRWFAAAAGPISKWFNSNGSIIRIPDRTFDQSVASTGLKFIENSAPSSTPFMAAFNFYAPHYPAEHPAYLDDLYQEATLPRGTEDPSFNEADVSDKPGWVRSFDQVDATERHALTMFHRDRLRSVEYVDRAVSSIVTTMARSGELSNTYIVFWTDNGFHLGQHRLLRHDNGGKVSPYTHDVEVPMYVRGPGIPAGTVSGEMVSNVDIAPTFADMGGASVPSFVDGRSMLPLAKGESTSWRNFAYSAAWPKFDGPPFNAFEDWRQIRTTKFAYHYYPSTGEEELYDLIGDPYQLGNLLYGLENVSAEEKARRERLRASYSSLAEKMSTCSGAECRAIEQEVPGGSP
jgi:N-acetylglucosamine-6-sulfatase